jgi:hypothetical protein
MNSGAAASPLILSTAIVLAFIQTGAAAVLFQVHVPSSLSLLVRHERVTVENKIAVHPVLTYEASVIDGSL